MRIFQDAIIVLVFWLIYSQIGIIMWHESGGTTGDLFVMFLIGVFFALIALFMSLVISIIMKPKKKEFVIEKIAKPRKKKKTAKVEVEVEEETKMEENPHLSVQEESPLPQNPDLSEEDDFDDNSGRDVT